MRFGAPLFDAYHDPQGWVDSLKRNGYNAAYCPVGQDASAAQIEEYRLAAQENDIVIAEVGAWGNNPLHPDAAVAEQGYRSLVEALTLAESIGARCCVNVSGSRGAVWDGPHPLNLTEETFERIAGYVNRLLDEVRPQCTAFSLEMMPWMFPTTAQENLALLDAVGRPSFVAHLDLVNITCSPRLYYENARTTADAFATLGRRIKSVHAKDIVLREQLTTHLDEVRPGLGGFDYHALLTAVEATDPDMPVMLEHLSTRQEYDDAAAYVRNIALELGIRCGTEV